MEIMTHEELEEFLSKPILARIATVGKNCTPHIAPVWFIYDDGAVIIGTRKNTMKIRNIKNNPAVAIAIDTIVGESVSDGAKGAIFKGKAELVEEDTLEIIQKLCKKYLGSLDHPAAKQLLHDPSPSVVIKLKPQKIISWDSSKMMR